MSILFYRAVTALILIESQWNLNNTDTTPYRKNSTNINRITVEFKCHFSAKSACFPNILIESQWNLNMLSEFEPDACAPNINRITVEFKLSNKIGECDFYGY